MKTRIILSALVAILAFACGKYEDGPGFSLRSKTNRITGLWEAEEVKFNGEVFQATDEEGNNIVYSVNLELEKNNNCTFSIAVPHYDLHYQLTGDWKFTNDKEKIELTFTTTDDDGNTQTEKTSYTITRLTNDELWIYSEERVEDSDGNRSIVTTSYKMKKV